MPTLMTFWLTLFSIDLLAVGLALRRRHFLGTYLMGVLALFFLASLARSGVPAEASVSSLLLAMPHIGFTVGFWALIVSNSRHYSH